MVVSESAVSWLARRSFTKPFLSCSSPSESKISFTNNSVFLDKGFKVAPFFLDFSASANISASLADLTARSWARFVAVCSSIPLNSTSTFFSKPISSSDKGALNSLPSCLSSLSITVINASINSPCPLTAFSARNVFNFPLLISDNLVVSTLTISRVSIPYISSGVGTIPLSISALKAALLIATPRSLIPLARYSPLPWCVNWVWAANILAFADSRVTGATPFVLPLALPIRAASVCFKASLGDIAGASTSGFFWTGPSVVRSFLPAWIWENSLFLSSDAVITGIEVVDSCLVFCPKASIIGDKLPSLSKKATSSFTLSLSACGISNINALSCSRSAALNWLIASPPSNISLPSGTIPWITSFLRSWGETTGFAAVFPRAASCSWPNETNLAWMLDTLSIFFCASCRDIFLASAFSILSLFLASAEAAKAAKASGSAAISAFLLALLSFLWAINSLAFAFLVLSIPAIIVVLSMTRAFSFMDKFSPASIFSFKACPSWR